MRRVRSQEVCTATSGWKGTCSVAGVACARCMLGDKLKATSPRGNVICGPFENTTLMHNRGGTRHGDDDKAGCLRCTRGSKGTIPLEITMRPCELSMIM